MEQSQSLDRVRLEESEAAKVVTSVSQEGFASFVSAHPYTVIWADNGAKTDSFPFVIGLSLGMFHLPKVRLGVVDFSAVEWSPAVRLFTLLNLERLQLKPDGRGMPPAGYYLFARGLPIGYHAGEFDLDKDGEAVGLGLFAGGLVALFGKGKDALQIGGNIAMWNAGERVVKTFHKLIEEHAKQSSGTVAGSQPPEAEEVLRQAYAALGLSSSASTQEVIAAHEQLVRKLRLNGMVGGGLAQEELARRVAELNAARDFILGRQGR